MSWRRCAWSATALLLHDNAGGDAVAELARIAAERLQVVEDT